MWSVEDTDSMQPNAFPIVFKRKLSSLGTLKGLTVVSNALQGISQSYKIHHSTTAVARQARVHPAFSLDRASTKTLAGKRSLIEFGNRLNLGFLVAVFSQLQVKLSKAIATPPRDTQKERKNT